MVSIIDVIDDKVVISMEVDFMTDLLIGILWNFRKDQVKEYDEVVASLIGLVYYMNNPCNLDLDLKN